MSNHCIDVKCPVCGHEYDARLHYYRCPVCGFDREKLSLHRQRQLQPLQPNLEQLNSKTMNFGQAIEAAKSGKLVARQGWNGKGMFIFMRPACELDTETVVNKVQSLPDSFKKWVADHHGDAPTEKIKFGRYLCMKAADGSVVNGWLASQTDMLSEDWTIVE
jgi:hypothetical protein